MLYGVDRKTGSQHVLMPSFREESYVQPLSDEQVASIANYVLAQYGNADVQVSVEDVVEARNGGPRPLLARLQPVMAPGIVIVLLLVIGLAVGFVRRARRRASAPVTATQAANA